eukprot:CAMPEP_0201557624 /NCGR_PEP_ID=MMETSP0173_2-20130828/62928_1 /ASSEMBLY_ACC=CAM_ASM_000268 /TAXON_ID=218659 /ORGANISM="Vexillifera sp., Strain DIVA3 564/2" /LENGTH=119 /DNA_ID=CAMNT_0047970567 /DNA_START=176 /DNA_END=532 /DNA_ORIENTATION=-
MIALPMGFDQPDNVARMIDENCGVIGVFSLHTRGTLYAQQIIDAVGQLIEEFDKHQIAAKQCVHVFEMHSKRKQIPHIVKHFIGAYKQYPNVQIVHKATLEIYLQLLAIILIVLLPIFY